MPDITPVVTQIDWSGTRPAAPMDPARQESFAPFNAALDKQLDDMHLVDGSSVAPRPHSATVEALEVVRDGIAVTTDVLAVDVFERLADDLLSLDADLDTQTVMTSAALSLAARQAREIIALRQRLTDLRGAA